MNPSLSWVFRCDRCGDTLDATQDDVPRHCYIGDKIDTRLFFAHCEKEPKTATLYALFRSEHSFKECSISLYQGVDILLPSVFK